MLYVFETYWPEPALGIENPVANAGAKPKKTRLLNNSSSRIHSSATLQIKYL